MIRRLARAGIGLWLVGMCGRAAAAEAVSFDISVPESTYVRCPTDPACFELFLPYAFGNYYPPGSIVNVSIEEGSCRDWPNIDGLCLRLFTCTLFSNGCGCNFSGVVERPIQLELHYDPATVMAAGVGEESIRLLTFGLLGPEWTQVPGVSVDRAAHALRAEETGFIVGHRWYAIAADPPTTAVVPATWSATKSLWR